MTGEKDRDVSALRGQIGRFQLFALGFGSIIGSAWVVILNQWLNGGGPGGAIIGFLAGGFVILTIGACYAELTTRIPATGGEYIFTRHVYGVRTAFFVGWFIALSWICVTIFEGLAIPKFLEVLLPKMTDNVLYEAFGAPVTRNQLLMGAAGALIIGGVNYMGSTMAARFHSLFTYGFLAIAASILLFMLVNGDTANFEPFFPDTRERSWWTGAVAVFASCAFLLNGFQTVSQVVEERSARIALPTVARIMMASILAGTLFYCVVILASSSVVPWTTLATADLAMVKATSVLPGGNLLAPLILVAVVASLIKTWNGVFMMGARVLFALARDGLLPSWLAHVDPKTGAPTRAVVTVGVLNILGLLLGRGAITAMVDMSATSIVFCFILVSLAVPLLRRRDATPAPYTVPGGRLVIGVAILGSLLMAGAALLAPLMHTDGVPLEYILLVAWAAMGVLFWLLIGRRGTAQPAGTGETE